MIDNHDEVKRVYKNEVSVCFSNIQSLKVHYYCFVY